MEMLYCPSITLELNQVNADYLYAIIQRSSTGCISSRDSRQRNRSYSKWPGLHKFSEYKREVLIDFRKERAHNSLTICYFASFSFIKYHRDRENVLVA